LLLKTFWLRVVLSERIPIDTQYQICKLFGNLNQNKFLQKFQIKLNEFPFAICELIYYKHTYAFLHPSQIFAESKHNQLTQEEKEKKKMSKNTNKDSGPKKSLIGNYRKPFWFNFFAQV
jgi:hypothetical protein